MRKTVKISGAIPTNPEELTLFLSSIYERKQAISPENLRYVIYARKSTDDDVNQITSIEDQIEICKKLAQELSLKVVNIIEERQSAKEPDIRPRFREMIKSLQDGKYHGIIAWHPDRLSRNMKEAGEIIDLLDKGIIADLKFKSMNFENTPSGKMLLGILFVMSKEYSDKLSVDIKRGNESNLEQGKYISGRSKHGYYKDANQRLRPDGENFLHIKRAFQMRLEGHSFVEIANFLNKVGYRKRDQEEDEYDGYGLMTKQKVEKFMKDPFYTGVLIYGDNKPYNLNTIYDFYPIISVADFLKINDLDMDGYIKLAKSPKRSANDKSNFLRGRVFCGECNASMSTGLSKGEHKQSYFYFRCPNKHKSVRGKIVYNFVVNYLKKNPFSTKKSFENYKEEMKRLEKFYASNEKSFLHSLIAQKRHLNDELKKYKDAYIQEQNSILKDTFANDIQITTNRIQELEKNINAELDGKDIRKTIKVDDYKKFCKLLQNIHINIEKLRKLEDIDLIVSLIFTNFTVTSKKVLNYKLNEPFDMLEDLKVANGGR